MPVVFQTGIPAEQLWGWLAGSPWNRAELQRDAPGADARDSVGWRIRCLHLQVQVQAQGVVQPGLSAINKAAQLLHYGMILSKKQKKLHFFFSSGL